MQSARERQAGLRRMALWAGLSVGVVMPTVGCQVEYAGMTLPSGKYMHDDVQYFPPGPNFPWANTQAATQRARMQAQGIDVGIIGANPAGVMPGVNGGLIPAPKAGGAEDPTQINFGGVPTNTNTMVNPPGGPGPVPNVAPVPPAGVNVPGATPPAPGNVPPPGGAPPDGMPK